MARRFAKVSEEEGVFYPSDLVNTKTTIPLRVDEERWIYIPRRLASRYIYTPLFTSPSEDRCILFLFLTMAMAMAPLNSPYCKKSCNFIII